MWTSRSGRRYWGDELDKPVDLVPLVLSRPCMKCKQPTWFARPRQRTKGIHPLCDPKAWVDVLTPEAEREALRAITRSLPIAYATKETPRDPR